MICQKLSHFHSRVFTHEFTWECYRLLQAKKFSRNSSQFKWVPKETRYYLFIVEFLKRNLMSQVAELFRRPTTMLKTLYFSGNHHFYQKPPRRNFIRTGIENFFIYWQAVLKNVTFQDFSILPRKNLELSFLSKTAGARSNCKMFPTWIILLN